MNYIKRACAAALATCALALPASATTYFLDWDAGNGNASGFLETDGTLGTLSTSNFVSLELTISRANQTPRTFTNAGNFQVFGSAVSATATELLFDFDKSGLRELFIIQAGSADGYVYLCFEAISTVGCSGSGDQTTSVGAPYIGNVTSHTGNVAFASTQPSATTAAPVPLPASLPLLFVGGGALAFVSRRKKAKRA